MIEVWGRSNAYNVQKVFWALRELGLQFQHHDAGSNPGDLETPEFLSMNPHARVPVISDKGEIVWESNTIIRYLFSQHGDAKPHDIDPVQRSHMERWMDWELATLQPDFIDLFWGYYRTPEHDRDLVQLEKSSRRCQSHFRLLDRHLKNHRFLAGDYFTMGDIPCATSLYRYFNMGFPVERPKYLVEWYQRLSGREPFRQCIMVPFDELEGRIQY